MKYQVYEVDANGKKHFTGKTINISSLKEKDYISYGEKAVIIGDLFQLYGFTQYANSYQCFVAEDGIDIKYNYGQPEGEKSTWFLKKDV